MEPLTPNDPLWKLLGKARPVVPRSNFTANVVREARNTSQEVGWLARVRQGLADWLGEWQRPALIGAATLMVITLAAMFFEQPTAENAVPAASIHAVADEDMALIADDSSLPIEGLDHIEALVAMENTASLTDSEIAFLLY